MAKAGNTAIAKHENFGFIEVDEEPEIPDEHPELLRKEKNKDIQPMQAIGDYSEIIDVLNK